MTSLDLVFIIFGLVITGLALFGFFWQMYQAHKDRALKRYLLQYRLKPDHLGNYPQAINPYDLSITTVIQPGNSPVPSYPNYLVVPTKSEVIPALPGRSEPLLSTNGKPFQEASQAQLPLTKEEVIAYLVAAKEQGATKTQALAGLGITGGRKFTEYKQIFDNLP